MKTTQSKNVKPAADALQSEVPFATEKQAQDTTNNAITNTKNLKAMKTNKKPAQKAPVVNKKAAPSKPIANSIKRVQAESAKLLIVKGDGPLPAKLPGKDGLDSGNLLQSTLRVVDDLSRKVRQREVMVDTIDILETFQIKQEQKEGEFNGCSFTVRDDDGKTWTIKNVNFLFAMLEFGVQWCKERKDAIERTIVLPKSAA